MSPSTSTASTRPMRPGTGTPVAGGPSSAKILSVLRQMTQIDIVGADVVEVAPAYDHADITAIAGATVAMQYLGLLAERKARERTETSRRQPD